MIWVSFLFAAFSGRRWGRSGAFLREFSGGGAGRGPGGGGEGPGKPPLGARRGTEGHKISLGHGQPDHTEVGAALGVGEHFKARGPPVWELHLSVSSPARVTARSAPPPSARLPLRHGSPAAPATRPPRVRRAPQPRDARPDGARRAAPGAPPPRPRRPGRRPFPPQRRAAAARPTPPAGARPEPRPGRLTAERGARVRGRRGRGRRLARREGRIPGAGPAGGGCGRAPLPRLPPGPPAPPRSPPRRRPSRARPGTRRARGGERAALAGSPAAPGPPAMSAEEVVQIRLEDRCYPVSKRKLIEQSDYFRALYRSGMREALRPEAGGPEVQQLRGLSAPGLRLVLDFINAGGAREGWLLGPRGEQGGGVEEEDELDEAGLLAELVEAASFLQVTSLLRLLLSRVRLTNCLELYRLAQVYGLADLQDACLRFMAVHFHEVLCKPQFQLLGSPPPAPGDVSLKERLREARMTGTPVLVALGDFLGGPLAPHPYQGEPPSMLRYEEMTERWFPLANNLPPDLVNVRGYGSAILDNYLFIVGGYRITSQEISAAHSYNPCSNEWLQVASMNQKR